MKLEVFYDYVCPYCYKGLEELRSLTTGYPEVALDFIPCEAHPRPEPAKIHSDLAAQLCYFLKDKGLDVQAYNDLVYKAHFEDKLPVDDPALLASFAAACGADEQEALHALKQNLYAEQVRRANELVWSTLGCPAVPSYRCGDKTAFSGGGVLVSPDAVEKLLG